MSEENHINLDLSVDEIEIWEYESKNKTETVYSNNICKYILIVKISNKRS